VPKSKSITYQVVSILKREKEVRTEDAGRSAGKFTKRTREAKADVVRSSPSANSKSQEMRSF
jgi:hypothetical protein